MKLFTGPLSLFARKVEIALLEKGRPFERVLVPFSQTRGYNPKHPEVLAANPRGQVPVLVDGDLAIFDSTVIFEYLEDACPEPALYPPDAAGRARCRLLTGAGCSGTGLALLSFSRLPTGAAGRIRFRGGKP